MSLQPSYLLLCAWQWLVMWAVAVQPGQDGASVPSPASPGTAGAAGGWRGNAARAVPKRGPGMCHQREQGALQGGPQPRDAES